MDKRNFLRSSLAGAGALVLRGTQALAQQPGARADRVLRIIVATPAGGASDTAARLLAQVLARQTGQTVLVDNKPGGNGVPAILSLLAAPADGQTLLWAMSSMAGMPLLVKSSPVKSLAELTPVAPVANVVFGLFVNPGIPAATLQEFSTYLKANPDKLAFATGVLSEYMATAQYLRLAAARAVRVPYKGGSQLMPDLVSGQVQFNIGPLAPGLPLVRSGKLRLLATAPDRLDALPGVPLLWDASSGASLPTWNGLVAPPRTPAETIARASQEVNHALADTALRSAFEAQGLRVTGGSPQHLREAMDSAADTWRQFIRDYDIPQE